MSFGEISDPLCPDFRLEAVHGVPTTLSMEQTTLIRLLSGVFAVLTLTFLIYRRRTKVN